MAQAAKKAIGQSTSTTRLSCVTPYTIQQTFAELDAALMAEGEASCLVIEMRAVLMLAEAQESLNGPAGETADLRRARVILATTELRRSLAEAEITARHVRTKVERVRAELERIEMLLSLRKTPP